MRLNTLNSTEWKKHSPYVDTLILQITPISTPIEKEFHLIPYKLIEKVTFQVEEKLKGRVLLLPPIVYSGRSAALFVKYIHSVVEDLSTFGFQYNVLLLSNEYAELANKLNNENAYIHFVETKESSSDEIEHIIANLLREIFKLWGA